MSGGEAEVVGPIIGVIGAGECDDTTMASAVEVGRGLAEAGCVVVTGGLGGVMEGASRGAKEAGGLVLAILPGDDSAAANPYVDLAVATNLGDGRNAVLANTADAFVAVSGGWGTLSEIAFALKRGKRVVSLDSWTPDLSIEVADNPADAVSLVLRKGCPA